MTWGDMGRLHRHGATGGNLGRRVAFQACHRHIEWPETNEKNCDDMGRPLTALAAQHSSGASMDSIRHTVSDALEISSAEIVTRG